MIFYIMLGTLIPYIFMVVKYENFLKKYSPNYKTGSNTVFNCIRFISFKYQKKEFKHVILGFLFIFLVISELVFAVTISII